MSHVISIRFKENQLERLGRMARRLGRTPSETAALLVEEALRQAEFGGIDFRHSPVGRQAYVRGTSLAVWEVVQVARHYAMDVRRTADHLQWPPFRVQAALSYAAAFPQEIELAVEDNASIDFAALSRMLPGIERFDASTPAEPLPVGPKAEDRS